MFGRMHIQKIVAASEETAFTIFYTLQVEDTDDDDYPWKYDGPPMEIEGLLDELQSINLVAENRHVSPVAENIKAATAIIDAGKRLPETFKKAVIEGGAAGNNSGIQADAEEIKTPKDMETYCKIQKLFSGGDHLTGPPLDICLDVLNASRFQPHDKSKSIWKYNIGALPDTCVKALRNQISAVYWMISKTFGLLPTQDPSSKPDPTREAISQRAAAYFVTAPTYGGFVVDTMGFTLLLYRSYLIRYGGPAYATQQGHPVVEQW
ncbi:hypothetical protein VC83_04230 [Pseudogymnoascus destructans]|uniref:Uncharacterized protein n=1 Tax=Pseudogymnoascus destructans TaxID=655981 RepID=A0A177ABA8_9PEZI|nr:uncharacterized protein VC83_04230 [Pseudogymnoascus destructans]OAF59397.2 hypothetical protein VC83_04230 [Pseudogymnoascus destructans]